MHPPSKALLVEGFSQDILGLGVRFGLGLCEGGQMKAKRKPKKRREWVSPAFVIRSCTQCVTIVIIKIK